MAPAVTVFLPISVTFGPQNFQTTAPVNIYDLQELKKHALVSNYGSGIVFNPPFGHTNILIHPETIKLQDCAQFN